MIENFIEVIFKTAPPVAKWPPAVPMMQYLFFWGGKFPLLHLRQHTITARDDIFRNRDCWRHWWGSVKPAALRDSPCLLPISSPGTLKQIVNNSFRVIIIPSSVLCESIAFCGITHSFKPNLNKSWNTPQDICWLRSSETSTERERVA